MPATTTKLSISVPRELLARADKLLARPGEGRSALLTRVLDEAVRAAEDASIDAEYERAYRQHPIAQQDLDRTTAIARAAMRSTRRIRSSVANTELPPQSKAPGNAAVTSKDEFHRNVGRVSTRPGGKTV